MFGDDASVLHRVFGEHCNCLSDVLYHYRTRAGQITTASRPAKSMTCGCTGNGCSISGPAGARGILRLGRCAVLADFYQFWCQSDAAGNLPELKPKFLAHKNHLDAILPDIIASKHLPLGEKLRAAASAQAPR